MKKQLKRKRQNGDKDNVLNTFMAKPEIFADLFNAYLYDGQQVIKPELLEPADRLLCEIVGNSRGQSKLTRYRDVFKAYRDKSAAYILLGVENQTSVHYAMPLRNMIYDALSLLARQRQKSAKHVALKELKRPDEFLSRFARTDYLEPVITLVVYFGTPSWDGPLSLHDMIRFPDDVLKRFMPDYFINLVVPAKMGDEMLAKLSTELCEVFGCIRFAGNKENFDAYIIQRPRFREMSYEAVQAINVCTHANIKINHTGEKINMCQAIIDMKKEAYDNGFLKGEESMCQAIIDMKKEAYDNGFLKGEESGFQTGFQQGKENITSMIALRMYYNKYDLQEIANVTGLATDNIEKLIQAQTQK